MNEPGVIAYHAEGNIYLNITNRCSCACVFCLREFTDEVYGYPLLLDHEPSPDEITQALELAFVDDAADEVVFCGLGEPTLRLPEVLAVTEWLRLRRIPARLDTNGHGQLANPASKSFRRLSGPDSAAYRSASTPRTRRATTASAGLSTPRRSAPCSPSLRVRGRRPGHAVTVVDHPDVDPKACAALADRLGATFTVRGRAVARRRPAPQVPDAPATAAGPVRRSPGAGG